MIDLVFYHCSVYVTWFGMYHRSRHVAFIFTLPCDRSLYIATGYASLRGVRRPARRSDTPGPRGGGAVVAPTPGERS